MLWNFVCLGLLLNIVINALLSLPSAFQQFAFDQPNFIFSIQLVAYLYSTHCAIGALNFYQTIIEPKNNQIIHESYWKNCKRHFD